jgi:hypothetical protein
MVSAASDGSLSLWTGDQSSIEGVMREPRWFARTSTGWMSQGNHGVNLITPGHLFDARRKCIVWSPQLGAQLSGIEYPHSSGLVIIAPHIYVYVYRCPHLPL